MALMKFPRQVLPERLDTLAAQDPLALRSRRDLQRVHRAMRSLTILRRAIGSLATRLPPRHILELGAGDGSLMLRLAQAQHPRWQGVRITFLDRQHVISSETCEQFGRLGWDVQVLNIDVLDWALSSLRTRIDLCITTLFLHHFKVSELKLLLRAIATDSAAFIALEPQRSASAWIGSHLLGLLGANAVTREDGVTSVVAGFAGQELTGLWPSEAVNWGLREYFAWPFTHCLVAVRRGHTVPRAGERDHAATVSEAVAGRGPSDEL